MDQPGQRILFRGEGVKLGGVDRERAKDLAVRALLDMIPPGLSEAGAVEDLDYAMRLAADDLCKAALKRRLAERALRRAIGPGNLSLIWAWKAPGYDRKGRFKAT